MKRLIAYYATPISKRWMDRYRYYEYEKYGFDVQIWDASSIFYSRDAIESYFKGSPYCEYKDSNIIKFSSFEELEKAVSEIDSETLLWIHNRGPLGNKLNSIDFRLFNRYSVKYAVKYLNPNQKPIGIIGETKYKIIQLRYRVFNWQNKPTLVVGTGCLGREQVNSIIPNKKYIFKSVPSPNILWSKCEREISEKYIVYVDENVGHAPDILLKNKKTTPCHDVKGFYHRINRVFNQIENWTGFQVVIAASGKFLYENNPFDGREIIYEKTQKLIQHSEIIIGHNSLGLEQAIVERKPILQLCDQGFSKIRNRRTRNTSLLYGRKPLWTDSLDKKNIEVIMNVDRDHYKKVELDYLREEGLEGGFIENMVDIFNAI